MILTLGIKDHEQFVVIGPELGCDVGTKFAVRPPSRGHSPVRECRLKAAGSCLQILSSVGRSWGCIFGSMKLESRARASRSVFPSLSAVTKWEATFSIGVFSIQETLPNPQPARSSSTRFTLDPWRDQHSFNVLSSRRLSTLDQYCTNWIARA